MHHGLQMPSQSHLRHKHIKAGVALENCCWSVMSAVLRLQGAVEGNLQRNPPLRDVDAALEAPLVNGRCCNCILQLLLLMDD